MDCYLQMLKQGWHQHQHITKRTTITVKTIHSIVTFFIFIDLFILLTLEKSSLCLFSIPYLILFSRVESLGQHMHRPKARTYSAPPNHGCSHKLKVQ